MFVSEFGTFSLIKEYSQNAVRFLHTRFKYELQQISHCLPPASISVSDVCLQVNFSKEVLMISFFG